MKLHYSYIHHKKEVCKALRSVSKHFFLWEIPAGMMSVKREVSSHFKSDSTYVDLFQYLKAYIQYSQSFVLDINSWVYCQLVTCQCPVGYSSVASQPTVGWHVFSRNFSSQLLKKTPNTVTKRKDAAVLLINVYPLYRVPLFYINTRASFKHSNHFPSIKVH